MADFVDCEEALAGSLTNVLEATSLKWVFVGGKGGVGKTTCSCSLAVQLAGCRGKVLIISTDPAHNLSDAFRQKFTKTPTLIQGFDNLYGMEVDPKPDVSDSLEALDQGAGASGDSFLQDLAGSIPGIDEAMSFAEVMKLVQSMDYDCIVFDTAPTGHTLRLLQFPSTIEKGLAKLASLKATFGGMISQVARMFGSDGGEEMAMMDKLEQLQAVVAEVSAQFKDPDLTTFVAVCIPEFLSLYETERLVQELAKFDMDCHNIIINQILYPEEGHGSRLLEARVSMQRKYLEQYDDLYEDFHLTKLPLLVEEVRGTEQLKEFSRLLVDPYVPRRTLAEANPQARIQELEAEVAQLKQRLAAGSGQ
eukprot:jgi/Tetstr1/432713/TSEL_022080.t1